MGIHKIARIILCLSVFLFIYQNNAFANAGTPLMWAGMFHLVIGNALIGIMEGVLIAKIFGVRKRRSVPIMILANYVSMTAGSAILGFAGNFFTRQATIYSIHIVLICFLSVSFLLTIYIERPFCVWIFKGDAELKKKTLRASFYAQMCSYSLMIPLYFLLSGTSLLWYVELDRSLSFVKSNPWIYYISTDKTTILRIKADEEAPQDVLHTQVHNEYARLFVRPSTTTGGQWDLYIKDRPVKDKKEAERLLLKNFAPRAELLRRWDGEVYDEEPDGWFNFGVMDFRNEEKDWNVETGFWAVEGFRAENEKIGQKIHIALETPFVQWHMRNVSILPGDQVVFQMGDQIVILDLNSRKMGLIAKGRGPIVAFDH